jgi:hypothetical protein
VFMRFMPALSEISRAIARSSTDGAARMIWTFAPRLVPPSEGAFFIRALTQKIRARPYFSLTQAQKPPLSGSRPS